MRVDIEPHEIVREACAYWDRARGDRAMPSRADLDPVDMPRVLPHLILIDVAHDPLDFRFRFRLIGTYVDRHLNGRYTGKHHRDIPTKGPGSKIWRTLARVVETGAPHVGYMDYLGPIDEVTAVEEAVLPLGRDGRIDMLLNVLVFVRDPGDPYTDPRLYRRDVPVPRGETNGAETKLFRLAFNEGEVTPDSPAVSAADLPNRPGAS